MYGKQFSVATPVELPTGKTIWITVGRAFEMEDAKYRYKVSLTAVPMTIFRGDPIELFLFEAADYQPTQKQERKKEKIEPPLSDPDPDVAF